jgi:predicted nucleic acid-binding protein
MNRPQPARPGYHRDAAYVAAAGRYRCALVTTDARLVRAAGIQCTVNLIS